MRTFITIFILLFLIGCSLLPGEDETKLTGPWNWVISQGGYGMNVEYPISNKE